MDKEILMELVERFGNLLRSEQRSRGLSLKLQPIHLQVLSYLDRCNKYSNTPVAVASYFGSTKGTISQSIICLESNGYIRKKRDRKDQRVVHLLITKKGLDILARVKPLFSSGAVVTDITNRELKTARDVLQKILRNAQESNEYRTFGQCRTCRYLVKEMGGKLRCSLTNMRLEYEETLRICHEHEFTK